MGKGMNIAIVFVIIVCTIALLSIGYHLGYKEGFDNSHLESHCPKINCIQEIQNKLSEAETLRIQLVEVINDTENRQGL